MHKIKICLFAASAFIITMLLLEVFFQLAFITPRSNFNLDPVIGKRLVPGLELVYFNEGFHIGRINQYSYLGSAYPPEKPVDITRIALYGDSFIEGFQLFDRHSLRANLENEIIRLKGKKVQVLNFGRSGFNLIDMYCYDKLFGSKFNPDIKIFFISEEDLNARRNKLGPRCFIENDSIRISFDFKNGSYYKNQYRFQYLKSSLIVKLFDDCSNHISRGNAPSIIFDKLIANKQRDNKLEKKTETQISPDEVTKRIMTCLAKSNNSCIVFKEGNMAKQFPSNMNNMIDIEPVKLSLINRGINPQYWKATNISGHWNHITQKEIGIFLAGIIMRRYLL